MEIKIVIQGNANNISISGGAPKKDEPQFSGNTTHKNIANVTFNGVSHQLSEGDVFIFNGNVISGGNVTLHKK